MGGAAGPGKTDCLIALGARYAQHASARGLFLRTTYTDLRDVLDRMQVIYPALGAKWVASDKRWEWPSGSVLQMGYGATLPEINRYVGRELTYVLFDELGLVPDSTVWTMLMSRVRSPDRTVPLRMRASANPGGPGHAWLKSRFVDACGKHGEIAYTDTATGWTRAYVPGTAQDNPSLPPEYWEQLRSLPPTLQAALRLGDWDAGLGLFYPEVAGDPERWFVGEIPGQVGAALPGWWDFWGAYDWGYRHPAVFIAFCRDEHGHVYVLDTLYQHRVSDEEQAATIKGLVDAARGVPKECLQKVYGGHDAFAMRMAHAATPETVADVFDRYGIYVAKASLDRISGSASCRRALASDAIRFLKTPGNRRLVRELAALVPDPAKPETPLKMDADAETGVGGDDGPDCFRYGMATVPWMPVRPIPKSDHDRVNVSRGVDLAALDQDTVKVRPDVRDVELDRRGGGAEGQFSESWLNLG